MIGDEQNKVQNEPHTESQLQNNIVKEKFPIWMELLAVIGVFIAASILAGLLSYVLTATNSASQGFSVFLTYMVQFGITIGFLIWLMRRRGERVSLGWALSGFNPMLILFGVIMLIMSSVVAEPLMSILPKDMLDMLNDVVTKSGAWGMLTTIVVAPVLEEVLFRGIIQGSVLRKYGAIRSVLLSATVFGVIHIVPQQVVFGFIAGLILGYIYYRTRSLFAVIIIHAINNGLAYLTMTIFEMKDLELSDIIKNQTVYWIVYLLCAVILVVSVWMLLRALAKASHNNKA